MTKKMREAEDLAPVRSKGLEDDKGGPMFYGDKAGSPFMIPRSPDL